MASEWSKSGVREVCENIAQGAIEEAVAHMSSMCGNAGQQSIVENSLASSANDAMSDISNGNSVSLDCNHPEAVVNIKQDGEEILNAAAERCATIREAARGHDGDAS